MTTTPEPTDKLDTMTTAATATISAVGPADGMVNGPKDETLDWRSIDWPQVEEDVRRLRQRIFTASRARP
jgi:RNA-directed DNA polymerase